MLSVPNFAGADVSISLPPALNVTATHSGNIDCRLQLLGVTAEWPAQQQPCQHPPQLLHARSPAVGFAVRCGGLLLAQALFPEHTNQVLGCLAVPVAVADGIAAVSAVVPEVAKQAVAHRASRIKHKLQTPGRARARKACSGDGVTRNGWIDVSAGLVVGAMHALRSLTGESCGRSRSGQSMCRQPAHGVQLQSHVVVRLTIVLQVSSFWLDSEWTMPGIQVHTEHDCPRPLKLCLWLLWQQSLIFVCLDPAGPAAAIAAGGWLLSVLHPSSHTLCSCLVGLMAVSADYQQLGAEIARGKHGTGGFVFWQSPDDSMLAEHQ